MKVVIKVKAVYSVPDCESIQVLAQQTLAASGGSEDFVGGEVPFGDLTF